MTELLQALERLANPRLLVVGDLMLDRYTRGVVERISPEAPVPVLRVHQCESRLGGAAAVATLVRGLGAQVSLAGVVGDDSGGRRLAQLLDESGIERQAVLCDRERRTTIKERVLTQTTVGPMQPLLRIDRERRRPQRPEMAQQLVGLVSEQLANCDALLISDYAKGLCTPEMLEALLTLARRRELPILVDPARGVDYSRYRGASLLIPNRREAESATGRPIRNAAEALAAGRRLAKECQATVLIKLDGDGLALVEPEQEGRGWPARTRTVADVTGAGDMVLAMAGLCRASGLSWIEAAQLANVAAGLEVQRPGVATVSRAEVHAELLPRRRAVADKVVTAEKLRTLAAAYRRGGLTVVLTNGCFDLLHAGHVRCLEESAQLGDVLVVALNSDHSVRRLKGAGRPVVGENARLAVLAALGCVDHVVLFDEDTPHALLSQIRPHVLAKGGTYAVEDVVGREIVEGYGGRVCVTGKVDGISTTRILESQRNGATSLLAR